MANPFLQRAKVHLAKKVAPGVTGAARILEKGVAEAKTWKSDRKVGLGLGVTSLGLSLSNMHNAKKADQANEKRVALEQKSLMALNKIHTALSAKKT